MPASAVRERRAAADRIATACDAGLDARALLDAIATELTRALAAESLFYAATDPDTTLATGIGAVRALPRELCETFWAHEFEVPDYNAFADLARAERPAADLHASTGGRPERSARYREFRDIIGLDGELRAAFTAGGQAWGIAQLNRAAPFAEDEVEFVAALAPAIGRAVRRTLLVEPAAEAAGRGPGLLLFDDRHELLSATPEAAAWLEEVERMGLPFPAVLPLPEAILFAAIEARVVAGTAEPGTAAPGVRTRVRRRGGGWLAVHASCLRESDGTLGHTAVVVEPAHAAEVAPLIIQAYELTPREVDVTRAVARGLSTNEIAAEMHLSRYTVQDHLKSVYEKTSVSSRGELVAKMFADHYHASLERSILASHEAG